jgi:hypothetical protein
VGATAFIGDWGSTKTLELTHRAHDRHLEGWRVVTNYGYVNGEHVETAADVLRLLAGMLVDSDRRPVFLGLDEAGSLFPARGWSKWPPEMDIICQQARKLGLEFGYTVPSLDNVDAQLRRATSRVVRCKAILEKRLTAKGEFPIRRRPRLSRWVEWCCVEGKVTDEKADSGWRWWRNHREVASLYDTYFMVTGIHTALLAAAARMEEDASRDQYGAADGGDRIVVVPESSTGGRASARPRRDRSSRG